MQVTFAFGPLSGLSALEGVPAAQPASVPRMLRLAARNGATQVWVVSAWLRRQGVAAIEDPLRQIAARGQLRVLFGDAFGRTSRDAVELVRGLAGAGARPDKQVVAGAEAVRRFRDDRSDRTFHPKVYMATSPLQAWLFVGSQNLTRGGMGGNVEAGVCVVCEPNTQVVLDVQRWFQALFEADSALPADDGLLALLPTELEIRRRRSATARFFGSDEDDGAANDGELQDQDPDDNEEENSAEGTASPAVTVGKADEPERRDPPESAPVAARPVETLPYEALPRVLKAAAGDLPMLLRPLLARLHAEILKLDRVGPLQPTKEGNLPSYHLDTSENNPPELFRLRLKGRIGVALRGDSVWTKDLQQQWVQFLSREEGNRWLVFNIRGPTDFDRACEFVRAVHAVRLAKELPR